MKKYIFLATFLSVAMASAQEQKVGVNTMNPKTTLDVVAPSEIAHPAGMQAPRLTREELTSLESSYTSEQEGTLVYVTDISGGDTLGQREMVTELGYYYFNGSLWIRIISTSEYDNIYISDGTLTGNRTVTQNDKTLSFNNTTGITVFENTTATATEPKSPLQIKDGNQGVGRVLSSDAEGNAFWDAAAVPKVDGIFSAEGGVNEITEASSSAFYNTGASITLTEGTWVLNISGEATVEGATAGVAAQWVTIWLGTNNVPQTNEAGINPIPSDRDFGSPGVYGIMNTQILAAKLIDVYSGITRHNITGMAMVKVPARGMTYYVYATTRTRVNSPGSYIGVQYKIKDYFKADGQNTYFYAMKLAD